MVVVSVSLSEKLLEEIDALRDELGFSGRSDVIRVAARMLIDEKRNLREFNGEINAVLFLIHPRRVEDLVTKIKHDYEDIIGTQLHSHLKDGNCLELFIIEGESVRVRELAERFLACGKMKHIKLVTF
ncbi:MULTISPECIES: CopG family ribbon-helix-helix protein [Methanothermobacter]|jgi:CopG family nickel-responsive transcriptional regulator|uniref:CopG family transcriptional regulator n=1 Tax=Methanothermobacter defluvii TaxID=49339 RepID=A0A371NE30_9EURY|nr:CopG family ribbon-helix-helix protein [Methanothermobacter defluvii]MBC7112116.1 CopG family ribbon-helix-helix protein [Methanothermobacter sp.]HIH71664.1 CopG family ribbon-helix-helix protein [Methanothermobacter thermautotrophicus]MDN5374791.1 CopG family transcriptional regulator, nickel-responsive regulator [Methanothermobacter sp.]NLU03905.1 CopG family ribbon-helix-helix protein [Methanothermobacter sp.]REE28751.1 CopG family transcriptional regulator [Methanothermobacter defluvii]